MNTNIIGYGLSALGIFGILLSFDGIKAVFNLTIDSTVIISIGIAILVIGLLILIAQGRGSKQAKEVPIYEGKGKKRKIVGYQKLK